MIEIKDLEERRKKISWLIDELEERYGELENNNSRSPIDTLIQTVLSQNTNDKNRDRAWKGLRSRFSNYREMEEASVEEIASAIKPGGLQRQKAKTIKGILDRLREEQGNIELDYLRELSTDRALSELKKFEGVGNKTAAIVLLFSLKKPYFPVDTHIRRVTKRLDLVRKGEGAHKTLNLLVPDDLKYQLHRHLIRHGRETCRARKPQCEECFLLKKCPTGKENID